MNGVIYSRLAVQWETKDRLFLPSKWSANTLFHFHERFVSLLMTGMEWTLDCEYSSCSIVTCHAAGTKTSLPREEKTNYPAPELALSSLTWTCWASAAVDDQDQHKVRSYLYIVDGLSSGERDRPLGTDWKTSHLRMQFCNTFTNRFFTRSTPKRKNCHCQSEDNVAAWVM